MSRRVILEDCSQYDSTGSGALIGGLGGALVGGALSGGRPGGLILGGLGGAFIGGAIGNSSSTAKRDACLERNRQRLADGNARRKRATKKTTKKKTATKSAKKKVVKPKALLPQPRKENKIVGYSTKDPVQKRHKALLMNIAMGRSPTAIAKRLMLVHNLTRKTNVALKQIFRQDYDWVKAWKDRFGVTDDIASSMAMGHLKMMK